MKKIGLALSGGGFRATLYHLGLARFLHDAGLLSKVTHISSVSGGSIFAAHLALNWDRYNGSSNDFDTAAAELLSFVRFDVRNRIVRRFPLASSVNWLRRLSLLGSDRKLTRVGMLEGYYQQHLYGDTLLSELPETPHLHILATNLSEGGICSFNRNGVLLQRRQSDQASRFESIHAGLATVPMAVAASSAFPNFFPPVRLSGADVGAPSGEFPNQTFTDGGVFDNLGVRLFRYLERSWLTETPLSPHDFFDLEAVGTALAAAGQSSEESPLRRLTQVLAAAARNPHHLLLSHALSTEPRPASAPADVEDYRKRFLASLWDLMLHYQLYREPLFAALKLEDPHAQVLLQTSQRNGRTLGVGDQVWLNRHLLEAAFRLATGQPCFRRLNSGLDGVLVSDVGKNFDVQVSATGSGMIQTAMRATDILMDRVWQLEKETFGDTPGFIFAPITAVVDPADDPTAMPPEMQRQTANIRTDMDRFSDLEIGSLVRHGYCIGRQVCRAHPDVFGADVPANTSWKLFAAPLSTQVPTSLSQPSRGPATTTVEARTLQASAGRRILSTLLDWRDWVSYLYVPILVPIIVLLPYVVVKSIARSHRQNQLLLSLAQGAGELDDMNRLLEEGPTQPWTGVAPEEVPKLAAPDAKGFEIIQDSSIVDLRSMKESGKAEQYSWINTFRRMRIIKKSESAGGAQFTRRLITVGPKVEVAFPPQQLKGNLLVSHDQGDNGKKKTDWAIAFDFSKVPPGDVVDVRFNYLAFGSLRGEGVEKSELAFPIDVPTDELKLWLLMPTGRNYSNYRIIRYPTGKPEQAEIVKGATEYLAEDSTILAVKILNLPARYTYELQWSYKP